MASSIPTECTQSPKPVQTPLPPIFFGGESKPALRRRQYRQGWMGASLTPEDMPEKLQQSWTNSSAEQGCKAFFEIKIYTSAKSSTQG